MADFLTVLVRVSSAGAKLLLHFAHLPFLLIEGSFDGDIDFGCFGSAVTVSQCCQKRCTHGFVGGNRPVTGNEDCLPPQIYKSGLTCGWVEQNKIQIHLCGNEYKLFSNFNNHLNSSWFFIFRLFFYLRDKLVAENNLSVYTSLSYNR